MLRRQILEESDSHERWLISYADFITLLFGFFVVMYAISSVNEGKYRILSDSLVTVFAQQEKSLVPIQVGDPVAASAPSAIDFNEITTSVDTEIGDTHIEPQAQIIRDRFAGLVDDSAFQVSENNDWLEINIDAEVLFQRSNAELSDSAKVVINELAGVLSEFDNRITVEGFADNQNIVGNQFPTTWELSTARATAVVRALIDSGVQTHRLAAVGHGENHPLETNATPEGRARNRRVNVAVARGLTPKANSGYLHREIYIPAPSLDPKRTDTGGLLFDQTTAK